MSEHSDQKKQQKSTQSQPKGFDPKQSQHSKHPSYDPTHPQGKNPRAVRSKVALQHIHRHGRGQG